MLIKKHNIFNFENLPIQFISKIVKSTQIKLKQKKLYALKLLTLQQLT